MPTTNSGSVAESMKHVTMQDIATRAGVTKATVSMVINNDKRITEATRQRVLKIVKELNYYPNESARKLAKGKTESIAFVVPRFGSTFIASILDGFEKRTYETKRYLNGIQPYSTRNEIAAREEILRKILFGHKADAVVLLDQTPSRKIVSEYQEKNIPMVLIETKTTGAHSVRVDNIKGAYLATSHLAQKGRGKIGMIVGISKQDPIYEENPVTEERLQGYQKALVDNKLKFDRDLVATIENYDSTEGGECLKQLLKKDPDLDAIFCAAGDIVAMGVMEEARQRGISIPKKLSLVGFDDILAARLVTPGLSTVRQSFGEIASAAFDIAMDSIDGKLAKEKHILLEPELIVRESA